MVSEIPTGEKVLTPPRYTRQLYSRFVTSNFGILLLIFQNLLEDSKYYIEIFQNRQSVFWTRDFRLQNVSIAVWYSVSVGVPILFPNTVLTNFTKKFIDYTWFFLLFNDFYFFKHFTKDSHKPFCNYGLPIFPYELIIYARLKHIRFVVR